MTRRTMLSAMSAAVLAPAAVRAERRQGQRESFEVTRVEVFLESLDPAHDGVTLAQLSDLHIGSGVPDGRIIAAVNALNAEKPDLAVLTGDFVTTRFDPYERVPQLLERIEPQAWAVLGNHDHWSDASAVSLGLKRADIGVLQNQHTKVNVRGVDFSLIGIDDSTTKNDDVAAAFKGTKQNTSRVVLTHTPNCAAKLPAWEDVLCLSGHTHGGQWDVPRLTEGVFKRAGQPYYRGHYNVRGNQLYVNRGIGFGRGTRLPRLNSEPELTLITLRRAEPR
ncbi:MAG: metallophosphoesterase [Myxococcales bacterium]|nr:metallophosphoesterase [Myxococcales bacterium]